MKTQRGDSQLSIAAAILAGGRNSRYGGRPKALEQVAPGLSILANELNELAAAGIGEVVVVTNQADAYCDCGAQTIADLRPGLGPLGGIETALAHYAPSYDATLFLPCDLPGITRRELRHLMDGFVRSAGQVVVAAHIFLEPLCTVVHNSLRKTITQALDDGQRSPAKLWRQLGAIPVQFAHAAPFYNVNRPEDLAGWQATQEEPS
jgi:molybdenum cofactor guanylyltransferase